MVVEPPGGKTMRGRIVAGLFVCSLFFVVGGDAQNPDIPEKPVWALEFITVQPENFALELQYLADHWMRVRAEAKRRGTVLDYHLIQNAGIVTPGHKVWDQDSIVLLTKYKNMDALLESQHTRLPTDNGFRFGPLSVEKDDLFEPLNAQVFVEEPDTSTGFKLLTKQ